MAYRITNITGQPVLQDIWQLGNGYNIVCEVPQACAQDVGEHSTRFDFSTSPSSPMAALP